MIAHLTDNPYVEHEPEIQSQSGEEFDDEEVHKPKWVRRWKIKWTSRWRRWEMFLASKQRGQVELWIESTGEKLDSWQVIRKSFLQEHLGEVAIERAWHAVVTPYLQCLWCDVCGY